MTNPWDRKHRFSIASMQTSAVAPPTAPQQTSPMTNVARATPTSSDQVSDYDEHRLAKERVPSNGSSTQQIISHYHNNNNNSTAVDHDEEVIVDNTDDDVVPHKKQRICEKPIDNSNR